MKWKSKSQRQNELRVRGWDSAPSLDARFDSKDVSALQLAIRGTVIRPDDRDYHRDRQLSNYAFQEFPLLIIYCEVLYDVWHCIKFARKFKVPVVLRSGGHSTAGFSVNSGIVIDLSRLNSVVVDAAAKRVMVGAGTKFAHLNAALDHFNLHVPGGICQDVCVAGFMQGGGYGLTSRQFGMNCDNVLEVMMMLADGRVVIVNEKQNADLFWAVRGGTGGNFGVVLQITYRLHEIGKVWGFGIEWPLRSAQDRNKAAAVLERLQASYTRKGAPRQLGYQAFIGWQKGRPCLMMRGAYNGPRKDGMEALASVLPIAQHEFKFDKVESFYTIDKVLYDEPIPVPEVPDLAREDKQSGYIDRPIDAANWRKIIDAFLKSPNRWSMFATEPYGGAITAAKPGKNAFIHRDVDMDVYVDVFWMTEEQRIDAVRFLDGFMAFMQPYFNGHAYQNYPRASQANYRQLYWGDSFARLLAIKQKYDPQNFFSYPQSVSPKSQSRKTKGKGKRASQSAPIVYEPYSKSI